MKVLNYRILLREEPEGGFTVLVPCLEGCITYGETLDEEKKNAREAIELFIESLEADGTPIPSDNFLEYTLHIEHARFQQK
ncbi:type II toxin-antitoxin system HicB family antitoxin [uncultured Imperialibacter sp.]|uniref:type II toxin-antitoxin system HicB family antitoxin n=1 Tax=uncultured Imperialibacter sp. TaxID=1672639 RepID=UPI0030DB9F66|tara:strand:+ start:2147 stop:2389 length:243 start_codon:yes stop_codon:yes gene_type:complete